MVIKLWTLNCLLQPIFCQATQKLGPKPPRQKTSAQLFPTRKGETHPTQSEAKNGSGWLAGHKSAGMEKPAVHRAGPGGRLTQHGCGCQNCVPLVNIKIGGKWMFIHPKMEPYHRPWPYVKMIKGGYPCLWLGLSLTDLHLPRFHLPQMSVSSPLSIYHPVQRNPT